MAKTATKAKRKATTPALTPEKRTLAVHEVLLSPTVQSAVGIQTLGKFAGEADLGALLEDLQTRVGKVQDGDMRAVEAMLFGQSMTLQTMFTNLARRATSQEYLKQFQVYMGLALKAQAQCRATLEALAEIKNPRPVSFVQQANIANGPQQVNNGATPGFETNTRTPAPAHAEKSEAVKNELLEHQHGNHLDTGAKGKAGRADPHMATLGTGNRAAHA